MTRSYQLDLFHSPKELERMKYLYKHAIPALKRTTQDEELMKAEEAELQLLRDKIK